MMESYSRTVYVTVDGKEFYNEKAASEYEETLKESARALCTSSPHFRLINVPYNHTLWNKVHISHIASIEDQRGVAEINFVCKVEQITNAGTPIKFKTPGKFIVIANDDLYYLRIEDISFYRDIDMMIKDFISNHNK